MSPSEPASTADGERTRSCATSLVCHRCDNTYALSEPVFACPDCGKGLDVAYDYALAARRFEELPRSERPENIWRFEELLPIVQRSAQARVGQYAGYTPLIHADRLGAELGLANLYLKDDSTSRPSLSYKDRVVAMSIARLLELGRDEVGCVSTGNVGTAVASYAAKAGVRPTSSTPTAWRPPRPAPAARSARRSARSTATTTKSTVAVVRSPQRPAWSSPTSPCVRSTRRAPRRRPLRSSSSSTGRRPTHSSPPRPAARCPRASTRACASYSCSVSPRPTRRASTSPSRAAATRSRARSSPRRPRSIR